MSRKRVPATALRPRGTDAIKEAILKIEPGQIIVYHEGDLSHDRYGRLSRHKGLDSLANSIYALAQRGRVHLIQYYLSQGERAYCLVGSAT